MNKDAYANTAIVGESGPEVAAIKKPRTVNHAAKCRKAWDAFHDAAVAASLAGVVVELTNREMSGFGKDFTALITANY